jgi:hypothetical protein
MHRVFVGQNQNRQTIEPLAEFDHFINEYFPNETFYLIRMNVSAPRRRATPRIDCNNRNPGLRERSRYPQSVQLCSNNNPCRLT